MRPLADADGLRAVELLGLESAATIALQGGPPYLVKGLVHRGDSSVWFGPSGCGKTFLALYIAHAVATGRSIFGRRVRAAPVALFALEGSAGLAKRLTAIQAEYGMAHNLFIYRNNLRLFHNDQLVRNLMASIEDCAAGLVIIDTLSRSMGGANENASEDMTAMVNVFDMIRHQTKAHTMLIHHTGKNEALGARGHSALRAAVDVEVEVSTSDGGRSLRVSKGRDDADGQQYGFKLKVVDLGQDDDGDPITTCVVEECEASRPVGRSQRKLSAQHRQALECLREAIGEHGERNVVVGLSAQICAIRRRTWLDVATERGLGPSESATDKALTRALPVLRDAKLIGTSMPWIWLTQ